MSLDMTKRRWSEGDCRMKQKKRKFIQLSWSFEIQPLRRSCSSFQFAYDKVSVSSASSGPNTSENQSCHRVGKKVLQTFYYIHIYDIQRDLTQKITQNTQTNRWFYHVICAPKLRNRSKNGSKKHDWLLFFLSNEWQDDCFYNALFFSKIPH